MHAKRLIAAAVALGAAALAVGAYAAGGPMMMGPTHSIKQTSFKGYYDGHFVTYLSTDISSKAEAKLMHINFAASMAS
jgi:hypothetical protein